MNHYRYQFVCNCPNNREAIVYTLDIQSEEMIMVEDIKAATRRHLSAFHETLADSLHRALGGHQVLSAHHHGVDVRTVRPSRDPVAEAEQARADWAFHHDQGYM